MTHPANIWLPRIDQPDAKIQLFCLPHAGGGSAVYHRWRRWLPAEIGLLPVKLPGREGRFQEAAVDRMSAMIDALWQHVVPTIRAPFALYGHSMGGMIAFELARRLSAEGTCPAYLFVSACRAPHLMSRERTLHTLPDGAMIEALVRDYGRGGQAGEDELAMMGALAATIRADLKLLETYEYQAGPPLACPICAISATEDQMVSAAQVNEWRTHTAGGFSLRTVPGHHFFLRDEESFLARLVSGKLMPLVANAS